MVRWLLLAFVGLTACSGDSLNATDLGALDQACYPNGTCNAGLTCVSKVCVDLGAPDSTVDATLDHNLGMQPDTSKVPDTSIVDASVPDSADAAFLNGNVCPTSPTQHACTDAGYGYDWGCDDAGWCHPLTGFLICDPDASDKTGGCQYRDSGYPDNTMQCNAGMLPGRCPTGWTCLWVDQAPDAASVPRMAVCP